MAIIPLRIYNREIEGMIDNGQLDEAVAHCRHILATFPKYLASYRLLGKVHLEQQRISDATDIFQRVLTAIPDDFISNVGMSIIREDENNLDAAIWHMELAYEAQPANIAIQDELRRLYGRRDGTQPPKVRLTRGALARMYAKGGLYDQAIAELRAAISEDPNRPDLQQLLAQMFYQTSQRVEAVETCVNILKKIPLCLEANRILAVSLPEAEGSDAVKNYRQTVISMDPYYAFAEPDAISSDQVPENAVNIERLEWKSGIQIGETPNQPAWATSLGISMDKPVDENIPDWLKSAEAPAPASADEKVSPSVSPFIWDTQEVEKIITDTSKPEGDIPDWMKDAGWKPAKGETTPPFEETLPQEPIAETPASDDLEKANLPEWLRGIAPEGVVGAEKLDFQPNEDDHINPWLEPHQPGPTDSIIQWLEEKKPESPTTSPSPADNLAMGLEEEVPDWLKGLDVPETTPSHKGIKTESIPAFTSEPSAFEGTAHPESVESETGAISSEKAVKPEIEGQPAPTETIFPSEIYDSKLPSAVNAEEIPDWLKEIAEEMPATEAFVSAGKEISSEVLPIPEQELPTEQPLVSEGAPTEEVLVDKEESIAQMAPEITESYPEAEVPGADEKMPIAESSSISEEGPATQLPESAEALPVAEVPMSTEEQPSDIIGSISEEIPTTEQPVVAEALPDTELTATTEELPTAEVASISEIVSSTEFLATEGELPAQELPLSAEAIPEPELPVITEDLQTPEVSSASEEAPTIEPPAIADELPVIEIPTVALEQPQAEHPIPVEGELAPSVPAPVSETEDFGWLESLIGEQAAIEEKLIPPTPEGEITPPEWVKLESEPATEQDFGLEPQSGTETPAIPAEEIPDWIKGLGEESQIEPTAEVSAPAVPSDIELPPAEELPAWLLDMEQPEPQKETPITSEEAQEWKSDELPAWLKEISESEIEEVPTAVEALPIEETPAALVEPISEQTEEIVAPVEIGEKASEVPQPETGPWVPEVEEPVQPVSEIPVQAEAEPAPVMEELTTKAVETTPTVPSEQAAMPIEMVSEVDNAALADARNAISQGQPFQAVGFYTGLIKHNYILEEIINDLHDALYRFPVDVDLWITLGDAQYRSNDLQGALDAYTKAEELVR